MGNIGVWIIGDQSSRGATSLVDAPADAPIVFVESRKFCERRPYHWQKLVLILSTMRHFRDELRAAGREVKYYELADDFVAGLKRFVKKHRIETLRVMEPNDHDRAAAMPKIAKLIGCDIEVTTNNQFLCSRHEFNDWAAGKRSLVMEFFYRQMRQKLNVLLDKQGKPIGGKWNLDALNRESLPSDAEIPPPFLIPPDDLTQEVINDVYEHFVKPGRCFGITPGLTPEVMAERFCWPVTPADAHAALDDFLKHRLANFGPYEDAMTGRSWSLWHSGLSVPLNCGLIHPKEILDRTLEYALPMVKKGTIPLQSLEGFVRQLIGWREFIHGIYWREMERDDAPYPQRNVLQAHRKLPAFYWTGQTDMACVREAVRPVIERAYSHHIPRLMVLSNFALLHGISPQLLNEWFIYAYADGYEWVTTPNVIGMSLYADGGIVATKPYAAGGAYINRMSDHCASCKFDPKQATGKNACPFTRAYWPFIRKHRKRLAGNPRTSMPVRTLDRMSADEVERRATEADTWFDQLEKYE